MTSLVDKVNEVCKLLESCSETVNDWTVDTVEANTAINILSLITRCPISREIDTTQPVYQAAINQFELNTTNWEESYKSMRTYLNGREQHRTLAYLTAIWQYIDVLL